MLLSLGVRCFRNPWMLTIRCSCGRERETLLPALAKTGLGEREMRTLGDVARRLRCEDCGKPLGSVIASYEPSQQREELMID